MLSHLLTRCLSSTTSSWALPHTRVILAGCVTFPGVLDTVSVPSEHPDHFSSHPAAFKSLSLGPHTCRPAAGDTAILPFHLANQPPYLYF